MFLRKLFQSVSIWLALLSAAPLLRGGVLVAYFQPGDLSTQAVTLVRSRKTEPSRWVEYSRQTFYLHGNVIHIRCRLIRPDLCSKSELEEMNFQLDFSQGRVQEWRGDSGTIYACSKEMLIEYLNYLYSLASLLPGAAELAASNPGDFTKSEDESNVYLRPKNCTELGKSIENIVLSKGRPMRLASAVFMESPKDDVSAPKGTIKLEYDYQPPAADLRNWSKPPRRLTPVKTTPGQNPFHNRMGYP